MPTDDEGRAQADVQGIAEGSFTITATISGTTISRSISGYIFGPPVIPVKPVPPVVLESPFEPVIPDDGLPEKPILIAPDPKLEISQQPPSACGHGLYGHEIFFDWEDAYSWIGVAGYHIYLIGPHASFPLINEFVVESEFHKLSCGGYIADRNLYYWHWWVQAEDTEGNRGPVSDAGIIHFLPRR
jgi:hypothetical protein